MTATTTTTTDAEPNPKNWRNRIVGHGMIPPDQLLANPKNWRIHPHVQEEALKGSLEEVGWIDEVTVNRTTDFVVDGHLRAAAAISHREPLIPVRYVELTEEEEDKILATKDPIGAMAGADRAQQAALLAAVRSQSAGLNALLGQLRAEADGALRRSTGAGVEPGQLRITPELHERQDYLVILFDNLLDWQVACERLGVERVENAKVGTTTLRHKGTGRVVMAGTLLAALGASGHGA